MTETKPTLPPLDAFADAIRFLTRLPLPGAAGPLTQALGLFGVAGAAIGAAQGLALWALAAWHVPPLMAAAFAIAVGLALTGALHEDGLADTADGLFGGATRERKLEIMRDSRIGTFGAAALALALLARAGGYDALLNLPPWHMVFLLAASGSFSRALMVGLMWATPTARSDGLAAGVGQPSRNTALMAIVSACVIVFLATPMAGPQAIIAGVVVAAALRWLAVKQIGGQTGDICGATQVSSELAMLAAFAATFR